jgi:hypothetical protein
MSDDFDEHFLNKDFLKRCFVFLCKSNIESSDPITDALATMLTTNIQYSVSSHGLSLFKDAPAFPYHLMNASQRQLLYHVVRSVWSGENTYSGFARTVDPLTFSIRNERIHLHTPPVKLDPKLVVSILVDSIASSKQPSLLLFNLMIQRLTSRVNVCKDTMIFANEQGKLTLARELCPEPQC